MLVVWDADEECHRNKILPLLALASGPGPRPEAILDKYPEDFPDRCLHLWVVDGELIGLVGVERTGERETTIQHLAVAPPFRGKGIGREIVSRLKEARDVDVLLAQTDGEGLGFYHRCGFVSKSLGELYPGIERFQCRWERAGSL